MTPLDARALIERVFRDHPTKRFAIRLWDGSEVAWGSVRDFTLIFREERALRDLMTSRDPAQFTEAYVSGTADIEGDVYAVVALGRYLRTVKLGFIDSLRAAAKLAVPTSRHTKTEDARDVQAHYDLSNEFYQAFLDPRMVYSCAYFRTPETPLEEAQERKLDLVCRKLRLKPGDRFLDIGCGWGALIIHAAHRYGVTAHGITLSKNQFALATERVRAAGLADRVTIELAHYADLPSGMYDKIASVGMIEHVGIAKYPAYFGAAFRALAPGGLFLNHGIVLNANLPEGSGGEFIFRHVFPGSEIDTLSHTLLEAEHAGLEIIDVEQLRPHYALTLRAWDRRFRARRKDLAAFVPERILRVWDLYLPGCALAFEEGMVGVAQALLAKNDANGRSTAPLTREGLFRTA